MSGPLATTTAVASPAATAEPSNSIEVRSATAAAKDGAALLGTGSDSPVKLDSSTSRDRASTIRQSADTVSPARSRIRSPATRWRASTRASSPPRSASTT